METKNAAYCEKERAEKQQPHAKGGKKKSSKIAKRACVYERCVRECACVCVCAAAVVVVVVVLCGVASRLPSCVEIKSKWVVQ